MYILNGKLQILKSSLWNKETLRNMHNNVKQVEGLQQDIQNSIDSTKYTYSVDEQETHA